MIQILSPVIDIVADTINGERLEQTKSGHLEQSEHNEHDAKTAEYVSIEGEGETGTP